MHRNSLGSRMFVAVIAGLLCAAVLAAGFFVQNEDPSNCDQLVPTGDTPSLIGSESVDLLREAKRSYEESKEPLFGPALPEPRRVRSIKAREATVELRSAFIERQGLDLRYAGAWYVVYARHHDGLNACVRLNQVWPGGQVSRTYDGKSPL